MATEDGYKRIDEIEIGDLVWAYNVETGELELKEVLTVYVKENREILHLETSTGNIDTTTNHPFYVIGKGWVAAGDLEVGDEVYTLDGSISVITGYWLEVFDTPVTVYNLEVEGFHTYFVGEFGVLVHNKCDSKSRIHESDRLVKEAENMGKDPIVQKESDHLIQQFLNGNESPGIGTSHLKGDINYLRGKNGARVFYRMNDGVMEILGKSDKSNEDAVIDLVLKLFGK